jgi:hypothetical protein
MAFRANGISEPVKIQVNTGDLDRVIMPDNKIKKIQGDLSNEQN